MIRINIASEFIEIRGHSGYEERGKDIVCAAVSALTLALARALEELTTGGCSEEETDGFVRIRYDPNDPVSLLLIRQFVIGVQMISEEYPEYVALSSRVLF